MKALLAVVSLVAVALLEMANVRQSERTGQPPPPAGTSSQSQSAATTAPRHPVIGVSPSEGQLGAVITVGRMDVQAVV